MNVSLLKEFFFIGLWIIAGALLLWSMDSRGLLAQDAHLTNDASFRIGFPEVYDIWEDEEEI